MELVRIISRAKCIRASTIIVDSTTSLKMEVTRGVEEIVQEGNRIVQDWDCMSLAGLSSLECDVERKKIRNL